GASASRWPPAAAAWEVRLAGPPREALTRRSPEEPGDLVDEELGDVVDAVGVRVDAHVFPRQEAVQDGRAVVRLDDERLSGAAVAAHERVARSGEREDVPAVGPAVLSAHERRGEGLPEREEVDGG